MDEIAQQQFDYGITPELPPAPNEHDGASHGAKVIRGQMVIVPVHTEGIWGTQPPLDPSLMDIAKIALLTRKNFGTDDLTLLIPKVSFSLLFFGFSPSIVLL
jgi:hypothetical protein